jgi:hypothetical protein
MEKIGWGKSEILFGFMEYLANPFGMGRLKTFLG